MSYILDALKRADRERHRGAPPDIHAQPMAAMDGDVPQRTRPWAWVAGGLAVGVVLMLAWRGWSGDEPAPADTGPPQVAAPQATPYPSPQAMPSRSPQATPAATPGMSTPAPGGPRPFLPEPSRPATPPAGTAAQSTAAFLPPAMAPATAPATAPAPAPVPAPAPGPTPARAQAANNPPDPAGSASAARAPAVIAWQDLPEDTRRLLPALKVGGAIHSRTPADRLLIVDGQVAREGDTVAPGVVLEQIGPRSAIFRGANVRYELRY